MMDHDRLAYRDQLYLLEKRVGIPVCSYASVFNDSSLTRKGPSSTSMPNMEVAPGPPLLQRIVGSVSGLFSLSMYQ
eukprot:6205718-Pleurochrysis_carterae.AAC.9